MANGDIVACQDRQLALNAGDFLLERVHFFERFIKCGPHTLWDVVAGVRERGADLTIRNVRPHGSRDTKLPQDATQIIDTTQSTGDPLGSKPKADAGPGFAVVQSF